MLNSSSSSGTTVLDSWPFVTPPQECLIAPPVQVPLSSILGLLPESCESFDQVAPSPPHETSAPGSPGGTGKHQDLKEKNHVDLLIA